MIYRNIFLSVLFSIGYISLPVRADTTAPQLSQEQLGTVKKALSTATFANSPPTTTAATYVADPRVPQIPSFSYTAGTPLPKAFPGAVASTMGAGQYSPQSATTASGGDQNAFANTKLTALPFFGKLPFASVVAANPQLVKLKVGDVFPSWGAADPSKSVGDTANSPLVLGDLTTAAGLREPSGFEIPYIGINGCGSKWSAESPNVKDGTIQQTLNFRICYDVLFLGRQATPYFLPLPLPLPANEQQANLLLPMNVKPVANKLFPSPTIPSVPSPPVIASNPTMSFTTPSASMIGSDKVALFGSATKNSYSPTLNIYSAQAKLPTANRYPV